MATRQAKATQPAEDAPLTLRSQNNAAKAMQAAEDTPLMPRSQNNNAKATQVAEDAPLTLWYQNKADRDISKPTEARQASRQELLRARSSALFQALENTREEIVEGAAIAPAAAAQWVSRYDNVGTQFPDTTTSAPSFPIRQRWHQV